MLVAPLLNSKQNKHEHVPAAVLLSSSDKSLLEFFLLNIVNTLNDNAIKLIDFTDKVKDEAFQFNLQKQLEENKDFYNKTGLRTVIFINEPEKFLGMNFEDSKILSTMPVKKLDKEILKNNSNQGLINNFKSLLDFCSQTPDNDLNGYATTFILASQRPHIIHPDFRDGKIQKINIPIIPIEEAVGVLFGEITKFLNFSFVKLAKVLPEEEAIKLHKRFLDLNNIPNDKIIYSLLNFLCAPSKNLGAYSFEDYQKIAQIASMKVFESSGFAPTSIILAKTIFDIPRGISPSNYSKSLEVDKLFSQKKNDYEMLIDKKNDGILTIEEEKKLQEVEKSEKEMLELFSLRNMLGGLTDEENEIYKKLKKRYGK